MTKCNLCRGGDVFEMVNFGVHPIGHRLLSSADEPEYLHAVILGFCPSCGLSQLVDPIPPELLYTNYHSLSSWKWNPHIPRLIEIIRDIPGINNDSRILEVGCNDGSFLNALHGAGFRNLHGVEPSEDAFSVAAKLKGVSVEHRYFDLECANEYARAGRCDLFIARQVVEHIGDLGVFGNAMNTVLREGSHVLIEVPDFNFNATWPDYSAIWEEHVNYFTRDTLCRFFHNHGVRMEHYETAQFSGQIIITTGVRESGVTTLEKTSPDLQAQAKAYQKGWPLFREAFLDYIAASGTVAVYGAGCRSSSLFNFTGAGKMVKMFLDDQPEKQGKFLPGCRRPILPGSALEAEPIDLCLLSVNAENESKVIEKHRTFSGRFQSVHPPSSLLPGFWPSLQLSHGFDRS